MGDRLSQQRRGFDKLTITISETGLASEVAKLTIRAAKVPKVTA